MGVKPNIVLDTMLRHNIPPENVFLCSDNDTAGNEFAQRLQEQYPDMKRVITPDTYKDWNDMLRCIPKQVEHETEKKEVQQTNMQYYGNEMWNKATDNRDKNLVTIQAADFARLQKQLDNSGINYYAYARDNSVIMAINDKDIEWLFPPNPTDLILRPKKTSSVQRSIVIFRRKSTFPLTVTLC